MKPVRLLFALLLTTNLAIAATDGAAQPPPCSADSDDPVYHAADAPADDVACAPEVSAAALALAEDVDIPEKYMNIICYAAKVDLHFFNTRVDKIAEKTELDRMVVLYRTTCHRFGGRISLLGRVGMSGYSDEMVMTIARGMKEALLIPAYKAQILQRVEESYDDSKTSRNYVARIIGAVETVLEEAGEEE